MQQCLEMFKHAGPCQKALFLVCAARSMSTSNLIDDCKLAASVLSPLLHDSSWQLRACAIQCLQRLMSGYIEAEASAHSISALLSDPEPFVRQSAATAVGCLGSKAVRYKHALCTLLQDSCNHVRYAGLITIGGFMAKGRPLTKTVARHLNDKDPKCRMAALRALKCMGCSAQYFVAELKAWQAQWHEQVPHDPSVGKKLEPITTRALMFPQVPLKYIFKGHAPLGGRFGGRKSFREARKQEFDLEVRKAQRQASLSYHDLQEDEWNSWYQQVVDAKEEHANYREAQQRYRATEGRRSKQKLQKLSQCRLAGCQRSSRYVTWGKDMPGRQNGRKLRHLNQSVEPMETWVIPIHAENDSR